MISFLKDDTNRLSVMLSLSIFFHAILLTIKFAAPELKRLTDHMPALDVVLVNTKTKSVPTKADARRRRIWIVAATPKLTGI